MWQTFAFFVWAQPWHLPMLQASRLSQSLQHLSTQDHLLKGSRMCTDWTPRDGLLCFVPFNLHYISLAAPEQL